MSKKLADKIYDFAMSSLGYMVLIVVFMSAIFALRASCFICESLL